MRGAISAIVSLGLLLCPIVGTRAQPARDDGGSLADRCAVAAAAPDDLSSLRGDSFAKATTCLSYLVAVHAALSRVHQYYQSTMPAYGNWSDAAFYEQWSMRQRMLAPDVCFPADVTPKALATAVVKYGKAHADELKTVENFDLAARALAGAYPCH